MTVPPGDTTTDTSAIFAALRAERDAALSEKAALAEALATRNSEFGERIEYQAATLDVLRAMSASPGDPQPVFDLIVERARDLCEGYGATVLEFDGSLLLHRASTGIDDNPAIRDALIAAYPKAPERSWPIDLAVLERRLIVVDDMVAEPNLNPALRNLTHKSVVALPLMRGEVAIGALALGGRERGGFSDSQIELLKTFAEQAVIAITSAETYRALQERTAALAARNSEYGERIEQQAATIDVLKVMSSSPGNAQPVFQLIVERAQAFCGADQTNLALLDGEMLHLEATSGASARYSAQFPRPVDATTTFGRAIIARDVVQTPDVLVDPDHFRRTSLAEATVRAVVAVPLLRRGAPVGAIAMGRNIPGEFSATQMELLKTFAEQAVIAISSAETYRALQTRTSDLQETLEYQTATSDVLKVISRSTFDLQPVLAMVAETAARLCVADQAAIYLVRDGMVRLATNFGFPLEYEAAIASWGEFSRFPNPATVGYRTIAERQIVHIPDVAAVPGYSEVPVKLGKQRTSLGVPLLRDSEAIGLILLARQRVETFTDQQIELVSAFADQAVIAIENTRLITEQREALEQQTATAEVLQVINANPGDLTPVFDAMLEKATRLCDAAAGTFWVSDGEQWQAVAIRGMPEHFVTSAREYRPSPNSPVGRLAGGEELVHLPDLSAEEVYKYGDRLVRAAVDTNGIRTLLSVPLRNERRILGVFSLYRREVHPFTDTQIALAQNFAAQAVIAMENARLLTEQREALEQQTATAEVLQVINSSPGNLAPVFDAMLEKAMRLCEAAFGLFFTYDGERLHSVAQRGVPPAYAEYRAHNPVPILSRPGTGIARALSMRQPLNVMDLMTTEGYAAGDPLVCNMVALGGVRSILSVPLCKDETVIGLISIYRQEVREFSPKQVALLENFAAQAVIAMENARLITETREALEQQTATAEVLGVINASPGNLGPVFDAILEKAHALCGAATGSLQLYDGEFFRAVATRGLPDEFGSILRQPRRSGLQDAFLRGAAFVQIADIADPALSGGDKTLLAAHDIAGVRTHLRVALRKDDTLLGLIVAGRLEVRPFSQQEISLLQSFAAQAVIAMENARLITETREALEQQTATAEVLQVINSSPGNLAPVFDAMLEKAMRLCEAPFGLLATVNGERWSPVVLRGVPAAYAEYRMHNPVSEAPGGIAGRVLRGERVVHVPDLMAEDVYRDGDRDRVALVDLGGARTSIAVGLRRDNVLLGIIQLYRQEVRPFSDRQVALLENFAAQAVIAMENARLLGELRTARDTAEASLQQLKAAQANLIQAEKMASLGQLTAGIAHEIKNPLNFVNNFAALSVDLLSELKETAAPGFAALTEKQRTEVEDVSAMLTSNLEKITEHGRRADGIVKAMLEHSRGSSGERRMVDLNTLIDEALNLAYHGARAQDQSFNIALERDFGEGIAPIEVNPQDITRVFLNLFANGFYAVTGRARDGGDAGFVPTLKVITIDAGEAVEIRVRDNGIGIPADIRDKLFQPFFTTKPTGEGTGLGLSITYDIVTQQHGGSIAVESEVGDYSEFTVRLPRGILASEGGRA